MMMFDEGLAAVLVAAQKAFLPGEWQAVEAGTSIRSGFSGDVASIDRLQCAIRLSNGSTDKASFTLLMRLIGQRQRWRIYALDWNPTSPHINPLKDGSPFSGAIFRPGDTHEHHFQDRVDDTNPSAFAVPVHENLKNYDDALSWFCGRMNIIRPPHLPAPPSQGRLL